MILLEVLMLTGRKQGWIMIEYKCQSAVIIGKAIQFESDQIFKAIEGSIRKEEWIV
jgi:hypothetical protein